MVEQLRSSVRYLGSSIYSLFQSISSHLLVSFVSLREISSFAIKSARPWAYLLSAIFAQMLVALLPIWFEMTFSCLVRSSLHNCKIATDNSIESVPSLSSFTVPLPSFCLSYHGLIFQREKVNDNSSVCAKRNIIGRGLLANCDHFICRRQLHLRHSRNIVHLCRRGRQWCWAALKWCCPDGQMMLVPMSSLCELRHKWKIRDQSSRIFGGRWWIRTTEAK